MKKKLDAKELGKWGLLFYNSLFMLPIACALAFITGDIEKVSLFCFAYLLLILCFLKYKVSENEICLFAVFKWKPTQSYTF